MDVPFSYQESSSPFSVLDVPIRQINSSKKSKTLEIYNQYELAVHEKFRGGVDYKYEEKPRQVIVAILLFVCLFFIGDVGNYLYDGNNEMKFNLLSNGIYDANIDTLQKISNNLRIGLTAVTIAVIMYCFLQTKDGLLVRPHPGVWRIIHGIGIIYFLFMCFLLGTDVSFGKIAISLIFPDMQVRASHLSGFLRNDVDSKLDSSINFMKPFVSEESQDVNKLLKLAEEKPLLDCKINYFTVLRQLKSPWFISHIIGWLFKMCVFRDWFFCMIYSATFELCELSLQWLIPEFKECWWDSLFLDFLISNIFGMLLGVTLLRFLNSYYYDWATGNNNVISQTDSEKKKSGQQQQEVNNYKSHDEDNDTFALNVAISNNFVGLHNIVENYISIVTAIVADIRHIFKKILSKFMPFTFFEYKWKFFSTPFRLFHAIVLIVICNISELNVFFLMYALEIPSNHYVNALRCLYLCLLALAAAPEHYSYVNTYGKRIGHNAWLYVCIISVELLVFFKYGLNKSKNIMIPPAEVILPWIFSYALFGMWCFFYFNYNKNSSSSFSCSSAWYNKDNVMKRKSYCRRAFIYCCCYDCHRNKEKQSSLEIISRYVLLFHPAVAFLPLVFLSKYYYY